MYKSCVKYYDSRQTALLHLAPSSSPKDVVNITIGYVMTTVRKTLEPCAYPGKVNKWTKKSQTLISPHVVINRFVACMKPVILGSENLSTKSVTLRQMDSKYPLRW